MEVSMLVITRKPSESLHIGDNITVSILGIKGNSVRVGVEAPTWLAIRRAELLARNAAQNLGTPLPSLTLPSQGGEVGVAPSQGGELIVAPPQKGERLLKSRRKVLIVDDSSADRHLYRRFLNHGAASDFEITEAPSGSEGLARIREERPDCILLDYRLPDLDGIGFLDAMLQVKGVSPVPVVMLTGMGSESLAVQAMKKGACDYLSKNTLTQDQLQRTLTEVLERQAMLTCAG
jgi:carbon storage regulator CsrA